MADNGKNDLNSTLPDVEETTRSLTQAAKDTLVVEQGVARLAALAQAHAKQSEAARLSATQLSTELDRAAAGISGLARAQARISEATKEAVTGIEANSTT